MGGETEEGVGMVETGVDEETEEGRTRGGKIKREDDPPWEWGAGGRRDLGAGKGDKGEKREVEEGKGVDEAADKRVGATGVGGQADDGEGDTGREENDKSGLERAAGGVRGEGEWKVGEAVWEWAGGEEEAQGGGEGEEEEEEEECQAGAGGKNSPDGRQTAVSVPLKIIILI